MQEISLATGASMRVTRPGRECTVLCINGGGARPRPGNWSPSIEWLVQRLAPEFADAGFAEVRYRVRSWRMLPSCIADGAAALAALGDSRRVVMVGFSMGGAVSIACSRDERVTDLVALAPWIPDEISVAGLAGDRVTILHGSLDGWVPGIPGVRPGHSLVGAERIRAAGADVTYERITGAVHGVALRRGDHLLPLPRAGTWLSGVRDALCRAGL
jgi:pimeloyl-ACP methyl ester carboxylesterase